MPGYAKYCNHQHHYMNNKAGPSPSPPVATQCGSIADQSTHCTSFAPCACDTLVTGADPARSSQNSSCGGYGGRARMQVKDPNEHARNIIKCESGV